jgi:hypothetical protein
MRRLFLGRTALIVMNGPRSDIDRLTVNCNPTAKSLPIRAGLRLGLSTPGASISPSSRRRTRASKDKAWLVGTFRSCTAVDNAVFMKDVEGLDVVVIMGGDSGMNELFVQPHIRTIEDVRGGRLVVDAPNTAFALQAYRILGDRGLHRDRDYTVAAVGRGEFRLEAMLADRANTAAILNLPYSLQARRLSLRSLGDTTALIGPYQAGSAFVMRPWAEAHRDLVVRYVAAYLGCLDWVLAPSNHDACVAILKEELLLPDDIAGESVETSATARLRTRTECRDRPCRIPEHAGAARNGRGLSQYRRPAVLSRSVLSRRRDAARPGPLFGTSLWCAMTDRKQVSATIAHDKAPSLAILKSQHGGARARNMIH